MTTARRVLWVTVCGILSGLLVLHALYFDYGDRYLHTALALIALAGSFFFPRAFTAGLAGWFGLIGCGWGLVAIMSIIDPLPGPLKPGLARPQVHNLLGAPDHSLPSARAAPDLGYAPPSPWRFPDVPVEVFIRRQGAVWVFYDGEGRVRDYFIGGSGGS